MAKYHEIDTDIWEELLDLNSSQKLLYVYLFSNPLCRPSGLYYINPKTIKHHIGTKEDDLRGLCGGLIEYDFETKEVWVRGKMKRILKGFDKNVKMQASVIADFEGLKSVFIKSLFISKYEAPLKGLVRGSLPLALTLPIALPKNNELEKKEVFEKKQVFDFDAVWNQYPAKVGRKEAERHFKATVKTENDLKSCLDALEKYKAHLAVNTWKQAQNGATWFNNWQDWVNWQEPERIGRGEDNVTRLIREIRAK